MSETKISIPKAEWPELKQDCKALLNRLEEFFKDDMDGGLTPQRMKELNADQLTLLAYLIFRKEMLEGGLVQLIFNGYGPFVFINPFAKALRLWGMKDFSKFVYTARELYEKEKGSIEGKDLSEDDFMALYEQHPELDGTDDDFVEMEPRISRELANFVAQNPERFGIEAN